MNFDETLYQGVMLRLVRGVMTFREQEYRSGLTRMADLTKGQNPEVLLIGCCDSRVDLTRISGAELGEVFIIRNVANLVPPYAFGHGTGHGVRAAIEYGVKALNVSHIVVFGHAHCGGINAAIQAAAGQAPPFDFLGAWLTLAKDACHVEVEDPVTGELRTVPINRLKDYSYLVERASVLKSVNNLHTYPWILERVKAGSLSLHGWWFDLETGDLWVTDSRTGQFLPIEAH
ncbi:MAG: carbonic anhydrase [Chromatiaceae bacterium]